MSSDASKAEEIFDMIAGLSKLPVNFFFIMVALFWNFGISFLIGLIPFFLSFMINKSLA
jgi:ATP-binding cassette subfamily C (CFTR/MRP) protein 1